MPLRAKCHLAKRRAKHCSVEDGPLQNVVLMRSKRLSRAPEYSATWRPRVMRAAGSHCTMSRSIHRIMHATASATE